MITHRTLPPEEWPKLAGTELEAVWPHLTPSDAQILVIEQDGAIVGCWALLLVVHVEGLWIAPSHRAKGGVARRLLAAMKQAARGLRVRQVATAAVSADVRTYLERLGAHKLPGEHFVLSVGGQ